jgi:hypothetical protein
MPCRMKRSDRTSITSIALSLRASPAGRGTGSRARIRRHHGQARSGGGLGSLLGSSARSRSSPGRIGQWRVILLSRPRYRGQTHFRAVHGTKLDITATDQIRPIATTTAIPTIHAGICIPLCRVELADRGSHIFSPSQCEVVHQWPQLRRSRRILPGAA